MTKRDTRRRFEQWAKNPECEANALSAVLGVPMAKVAVAEGGESTTGQSKFALQRGQRFEASLFANGAAQLREELVKAGVLPAHAVGFVDLRLRRAGGPQRDLDSALARTAELIAAHARGDEAPCLIASATIRVPGGAMLPEAILCIDALVLTRSARPVLVVGEIKTYPDRGGYTDRVELATARAQAGIYVHGLREVIAELGIGRLDVAMTGFLVLTRPGSNQPSIRAREDLEFQAERARRGLEKLRAVAGALEVDGAGEPRDPVGTIQRAETRYCEGCVRFCDRASRCHAVALAAGRPAVLGDAAERFLGSIDLHRATVLLGGASPRSPAETDLVRRLRELGGT